MKFIYFFVLVVCLLPCLLFSTISQINDINNERHVFRYDNNRGTVIYYDNRIIALNDASVIEYTILPDGVFQEISYH